MQGASSNPHALHNKHMHDKEYSTVPLAMKFSQLADIEGELNVDDIRVGLPEHNTHQRHGTQLQEGCKQWNESKFKNYHISPYA